MDERPFDTINVIPLVDIMLVLLTVVLTTSSFIASGRMSIQPPRASQAQQEHILQGLIEIGPGGQLQFQGHPATLAGLAEQLSALDRQSDIVVRADRDVPLQYFIDVMDLLGKDEFHRVSIQTQDH